MMLKTSKLLQFRSSDINTRIDSTDDPIVSVVLELISHMYPNEVNLVYNPMAEAGSSRYFLLHDQFRCNVLLDVYYEILSDLYYLDLGIEQKMRISFDLVSKIKLLERKQTDICSDMFELDLN